MFLFLSTSLRYRLLHLVTTPWRWAIKKLPFIFYLLLTSMYKFLYAPKYMQDNRNPFHKLFQNTFNKFTFQKLGFFMSIPATSCKDLLRKAHSKQYFRFCF